MTTACMLSSTGEVTQIARGPAAIHPGQTRAFLSTPHGSLPSLVLSLVTHRTPAEAPCGCPESCPQSRACCVSEATLWIPEMPARGSPQHYARILPQLSRTQGPPLEAHRGLLAPRLPLWQAGPAPSPVSGSLCAALPVPLVTKSPQTGDRPEPSLSGSCMSSNVHSCHMDRKLPGRTGSAQSRQEAAWGGLLPGRAPPPEASPTAHPPILPNSPLDVGVIVLKEVIVVPPVLKNVLNETAWEPHGDKSAVAATLPVLRRMGCVGGTKGGSAASSFPKLLLVPVS